MRNIRALVLLSSHRLIIRAMPGIRLADRMARLGAESASKVLARARTIKDAGIDTGEPGRLIAHRSTLPGPAGLMVRQVSWNRSRG